MLRMMSRKQVTESSGKQRLFVRNQIPCLVDHGQLLMYDSGEDVEVFETVQENLAQNAAALEVRSRAFLEPLGDGGGSLRLRLILYLPSPLLT